MKKAIWASMAFLVLISMIILYAQNFTYVGAGKCQICHKTEKQGLQYPIWEKSKHAASASAPASTQGATIAQQAGVQKPGEDPKCLKCHAPLFEKAADLKAEGVTCEVCHGPGSEYKRLSVMKNKEEAVKNGLKVYGSQDAIKAHCLNCHENAHGKSFDFAAAWEKIKHPVPK